MAGGRGLMGFLITLLLGVVLLLFWLDSEIFKDAMGSDE
jgi:hypothetical protein